MQRHSTASCFATYLLPHVLFVADPEERGRIAGACCLAWNIALFPDARERERHIERTLDLVLDDGAVPPPPGFRQGFGGELRMLVDLKRDLFPWRLADVMHADLGPGPGGGADVLSVDADGAVERIELVLNPSIMGAPVITEALVRMREDTEAQRRTLEEAARDTPAVLERAVAPDMLTAYCAQRADLRGYHRMLAEWREAAFEPELKSALGRFLSAVDEIEDDTRAVLGILAAALGAPRGER